MPPRRSWRSDRCSSMRFILLLLGEIVDDVSVVGELADERIDSAQRELHGRMPLEVAAHEAVRGDREIERGGAGIVDGGSSVLAGEREHAEDAPHAVLLLPVVDLLGETSDVLSCPLGAKEQILRAAGRARRPILLLRAVVSRPVPQVLAQQHPALRIEDPHLEVVPLHPDGTADVTGRDGVVGAGDLDVPVEVHGAIAVLVEAEGLDRAAAAGRASPRQTSPRPGAWWCRGCACRPSGSPSGRDRLGLPRVSRSGAPSAASSACGRHSIRLSPCDRDRARGTAAPPRRSARGSRGRED